VLHRYKRTMASTPSFDIALAECASHVPIFDALFCFRI
jgi:hypothetical protein